MEQAITKQRRRNLIQTLHHLFKGGKNTPQRTQPSPATNPPQTPPTPHPANTPEPEIRGGVIICTAGMYRYATFRIDNGEELIIGRDAAMSHIVVDTGAEKVSRKHCSIIYDGRQRQYIVTDYSSNGTYTDDNTRLTHLTLTILPCATTIYLGDRQNSFLLN